MGNRIFRAAGKLIKSGFPQQAFIDLVLNTDGELLYLGSICLSRGDRIIYFPSTKENIIESDPTKKYIGREIDHLTLQKNLKRWHITLVDEEHTKLKLKTRNIEVDLFYWFSLNLKSLNSLPRFLERGDKYSISAVFSGIPPTHSDQRERFLKEAIEEGRTEILRPKVFMRCPFSQDNKYFHFSFLIDRAPHKEKKKNFINPPLQPEEIGCGSGHIIKIKENLTLVMVCAYLTGVLNHKILYNFWPTDINAREMKSEGELQN